MIVTAVWPIPVDFEFPKFAILLLYYISYAKPRIRASRAAYSSPVTVVSSIPERLKEMSVEEDLIYTLSPFITGNLKVSRLSLPAIETS